MDKTAKQYCLVIYSVYKCVRVCVCVCVCTNVFREEVRWKIKVTDLLCVHIYFSIYFII